MCFQCSVKRRSEQKTKLIRFFILFFSFRFFLKCAVCAMAAWYTWHSVGFGCLGLITATILRFAVDMIKYATLHFCIDKMAEHYQMKNVLHKPKNVTCIWDASRTIEIRDALLPLNNSTIPLMARKKDRCVRVFSSSFAECKLDDWTAQKSTFCSVEQFTRVYLGSLKLHSMLRLTICESEPSQQHFCRCFLSLNRSLKNWVRLKTGAHRKLTAFS